MRYTVLMILWLFSGFGIGAFSPLDESVWSASMYNQYNYENFQDYAPFHVVIDFNAIDFPLIHAALFFTTNSVRASENLPPLVYSPQLETAAYNHSASMVRLGYFSHISEDPSRRTGEDRALNAGVTNPFIAENIAINFGLEYTPGTAVYFGTEGEFFLSPDSEPLETHSYVSLAKALVDQWMDSPGHRRIILSENALALGAGVEFRIDRKFNMMVEVLATQNFQWYETIVPGDSLDPPPPGWKP